MIGRDRPTALLSLALLLFTISAVAAPVADFGPHEFVVTHRQIEWMHSSLSRKLTERLGDRHRKVLYEPAEASPLFDERGTLMWVRDYFPIWVQRDRLEPVYYLGRDQVRNDYLAQTIGRHAHLLPLIHENGNLVSTGSLAIMTDLIFEDNGVALADDDNIDASLEPRTRREVLALMANALALSPEKIIILPRLPEEGTGHVDLFVLPLGKGEVMVPSIPLSNHFRYISWDEKILALDASLFLDVVSDTLEKKGLIVTRAPMLPPSLLPAVDGEEDDFDAIYLSPANSLLFDDLHDRVAFLPTFTNEKHLSTRMRGVQARYELLWLKIFRGHGWEVDFIDPGDLSRHLGLLRCVTAPDYAGR